METDYIYSISCEADNHFACDGYFEDISGQVMTCQCRCHRNIEALEIE